MSAFDQVKSWLTIPRLWDLLGVQGYRPEVDQKKFRNPFRPDQHPSCSFFDSTRQMRDWSRAESYDIGDFYALCAGLERKDGPIGLVRFMESHGYLAANGRGLPPPKRMAPPPPAPKARIAPRPGIEPLALRAPTGAECRQLGALRGLDFGAFDLAGKLGTLRVGMVCGHFSWVLTDQRGLVAEARRFDGKPYPASGTLEARKTHTIRGSDKSWPVGLLPCQSYELRSAYRGVFMVEGSGDYFAALELVAIYGPGDLLPCAILGVNNEIDAGAIQIIGSYSAAIIVPQRDAAGLAAANKWLATLHAGGAPKARIVELSPEAPGKDLGEIMALIAENEKTKFAHDYCCC
jgi:hypothetical protein